MRVLQPSRGTHDAELTELGEVYSIQIKYCADVRRMVYDALSCSQALCPRRRPGGRF